MRVSLMVKERQFPAPLVREMTVLSGKEKNNVQVKGLRITFSIFSRSSCCLHSGPPVLLSLRAADRQVLQEEEAEVLARRDGDAPDVQDAPGVPAILR